MARTRYELDTRVLTLFLLVTMPFIAFGSFMVVNMARTALQDAVGRSLEQHAVETAIQVERYVGGHLVHLQWIASSPEVQRGLGGPAMKQAAPDVKRLEQSWIEGDPRLLAEVSRSPLADRLREATRLHPALLLVQVVDARGRLVATSSRGGRVWNAEAPWFRALVQDDTGLRPYVSDVQASRSGLPALELAVPIRRESDQGWLGGVRAVIDASDLDSVLAPVRVGRTGHAVLMRGEDGLVLGSDVPQQVLKGHFPGFRYVQAARTERRGYWAMPEIRAEAGEGGALIEPRRIVGLGAAHPVAGLDWMVAVEQDLGEALAPVEEVVRYLWIHFAGALGTAVLLAFYLSFKLERPVIEDELHLHAEHVPSAAR